MAQSKSRGSSIDRRRFLQYTWQGVGASLSLALVSGRELFAAPLSGRAIPSRSASPLAIRCRTASCSGRGSRPSRPIPRASAAGRSPSAGAWPPTATCVTSSRAAAPWRRPSSRMRCTWKWMGCSRSATTSISSTCATRKAGSVTSARRRRSTRTCGSCSSRSRPARTGRAASTPPTGTCCRTISTSCSIWATTPTSTRSAARRGAEFRFRADSGGRPWTSNVSPPAYPLQARSRSAGGAREVPVRRHLGRSRGPERLFRAGARMGFAFAGVHGQTRRGLPGLLRAHADSSGDRPQPDAIASHLSQVPVRAAGRIHACSTIGSTGPTTRAATASRCGATKR